MSTQPRLQPTRRTLLRTAAWTAPAVSIAVAAPAFACSTTCSVTGFVSGTNFNVTITGITNVTRVIVDSTLAQPKNGVYEAKLGPHADRTQPVHVTADGKTTTYMVTFAG